MPEFFSNIGPCDFVLVAVVFLTGTLAAYIPRPRWKAFPALSIRIEDHTVAESVCNVERTSRNGDALRARLVGARFLAELGFLARARKLVADLNASAHPGDP